MIVMELKNEEKHELIHTRIMIKKIPHPEVAISTTYGQMIFTVTNKRGNSTT
jgi:hypothetical protein